MSDDKLEQSSFGTSRLWLQDTTAPTQEEIVALMERVLEEQKEQLRQGRGIRTQAVLSFMRKLTVSLERAVNDA